MLCCNICGSTEKIVRDHDHETGFIRGPLCERCNSWLSIYERIKQQGLPFEVGTRYSTHRRAKLKKRHAAWISEYRDKIEAHLKSNTGVLYPSKSPTLFPKVPLQAPNGCNICGSTQNLVRDHDHATGIIRGPLCEQCNCWIGIYEHVERLGKPFALGIVYGKKDRVKLRKRHIEWHQKYAAQIEAHLKSNTGVLYSRKPPKGLFDEPVSPRI